MKKEDLFSAIGEADSVYLEESERIMPAVDRMETVKKVITAAAVILLFSGALILPRLLLGDTGTSPSHEITTAPHDVTDAPDITLSEVTVESGERYILPLPREYAHLCTVITDSDTYKDTAIIVISYTPEYEKSGYGEMLSIHKYSAGEYERNYLDNLVFNLRLLGTDGKYYYVMSFPSDVTVDPTDTAFPPINGDVRETVSEYFAEVNQLEFVDADAFFDREYTYSGEHRFIRYYPYGKERDYYYTLVLSQPAVQGDGGIWCVERWYDDMKMVTTPGYAEVDFVHGDTHTVYYAFPQSGDLSALEYYRQMQSEYDEGGHSAYGDPLQVALHWVKTSFSHDFATPEMFETVTPVE